MDLALFSWFALSMRRVRSEGAGCDRRRRNAADYDLVVATTLAPRGARGSCWRTMMEQIIGRRLLAGLGWAARPAAPPSPHRRDW
jgi:hypothetical protein